MLLPAGARGGDYCRRQARHDQAGRDRPLPGKETKDCKRRTIECIAVEPAPAINVRELCDFAHLTGTFRVTACAAEGIFRIVRQDCIAFATVCQYWISRIVA
jgi:hypothetical protein